MATIFEDDFNSYNDGDLNGQGNWAQGAEIDVQGTTVYEGAKAIKGIGSADGGASIVGAGKVGSTVNDGQTVFYMRRDADNNIGGFYFYLRYGSVDDWPNRRAVLTFRDGNIEYVNSASAFVTIQAYSTNQWYEIKIEWRSSDGKVKYTITDGSATDWVNPVDATTAPSIIAVSVGGGTANDNAYWDHIAEYPYSPADEEVANAIFFGANF